MAEGRLADQGAIIECTIPLADVYNILFGFRSRLQGVLHSAPRKLSLPLAEEAQLHMIDRQWLHGILPPVTIG